MSTEAETLEPAPPAEVAPSPPGSSTRGGFKPRPGPAGICVAPGCDNTTAGNRWYCDEHAPPSKKRKGTGPRGGGPSSRPKPPSSSAPAARRTSPAPRGPARVSDDAARSTLGRILVILTVILMTYAVRRAGIADPSGQLADDLSLSNSEARDLAAPLARWSNQTAVGSRVIAPIARNEDVLAALYALWSYQRRVSQFFDDHRAGHPLAVVSPLRAEPTAAATGADEEGEASAVDVRAFAGASPPLTLDGDGRLAGADPVL